MTTEITPNIMKVTFSRPAKEVNAEAGVLRDSARDSMLDQQLPELIEQNPEFEQVALMMREGFTNQQIAQNKNNGLVGKNKLRKVVAFRRQYDNLIREIENKIGPFSEYQKMVRQHGVSHLA